MKNKKTKNERGSITIFVLTGMMFMLIVLMTAYAGINNKLQAQNKKIETIKLQYEGNDIEQEYKEAKERIKKPISKETPYVGCYADIDDDGTADGVIYADLAVGNTGSGKWYDSDGIYTIPKETEGLKDYYVKDEDYTSEKFGNTTAKLIAPIEGSSGTKERFYVMALEDFNKGTFYDWYNAAKDQMSDYSSTTSVNFGKGKANTETMISKWNAKAYGDQDKCSSHKDMWGQIQEKVNKGWFVPSRAEWAAFAGELGITSSNYEDLGLSHYYWSSSQNGTSSAWFANFFGGFMDDRINVDRNGYVSLSATF